MTFTRHRTILDAAQPYLRAVLAEAVWSAVDDWEALEEHEANDAETPAEEKDQ